MPSPQTLRATALGAGLPIVLAVVLPACPLDAQVPDRFLTAHFENDTFYDTDQSYTNGVRISGAHRAEGDLRVLPTGVLERRFRRDCEIDPNRCWEWWSGWVVGQSMYTPQELEDSEIIPDDRPYGGWLYGGPTFTASRPARHTMRATEHAFQLLLGVTGRPSLAGPTQRFVHDHIATGAADPLGWHHQIRAEPTVNLLYSGRQRQLEAFREGGGRYFDLVSEWSLAAGNVFTYGGGGAALRLGWNLGEDFGAGRIEPVIAMAGREHRTEGHLFARIGARYTLWNAFLQGGWFRASPHTVDPERVVADLEVGATFRWRRVVASGRWVRRSPEFDARLIYQEYGSLTVSWLR